MTLQNYLFEMNELYKQFLDFIEAENDLAEENTNKFDFLSKIQQNVNDLKEFLHLVARFSVNHNKLPNFFEKVKEILIYLQPNIIQNLSNSHIFNTFRKSKPILLFLIEQKILIPNIKIAKLMEKYKTYTQFFYPEIKDFIDEEERQKIKEEIFSDDLNSLTEFEKRRKIGENDSYICKLIREDSIDEFIPYIHQNNFQLSETKITPSIYETNYFLIKREPTLIEYSAFFGSIQIFQYLKMNDVKLSQSLWLFAIHSNNVELFHILEENNVELPENSYEKCLKEGIKCHHNEISDYILENLMDSNIIEENISSNFDKNIISYGFQYSNHFYLSYCKDNKFLFHYACKYDYINIVEFFVKEEGRDFNEEIIYTHF